MIAMAWKHENVYIGSRRAPAEVLARELRQYINSFGQDKVIFGTDFPVLRFKRTATTSMRSASSPRCDRKLLRDNALRVYRLG